METIFMNMENRKTNKTHRFVHSMPQSLELRISNKNVALSIYYTLKNIRKQYKNNKLKIIPTTWNDEVELPDGSHSVSDIQDYIKYIIPKQETLKEIPGIDI